MRTTLFCCSTLVVLCSTNTFAENERVPNDAIPVVAVEPLDYLSLFEEDIEREKLGLPFRFADTSQVSISPVTHGLWERIEGNKLRWTCRVKCGNAQSMNFGFTRYTMPSSGTMVIKDALSSFQIRPFTAQDNQDHGELWTPIVPSTEVLIEIIVDRFEKRLVNRQIELTSINAGYRGLRGGDERGSSESCNVDVMCPIGDDWWDEIPSVALITISGGWVCSGVMVNNTAEDQTPYFMTANHCASTTSEASSIVAYWNHQNSYCRTGSDSGSNGNGNLSQFTSGSTLRATRNYTDFTLVELSSNPNSAYGVTYSGWSRSSSTDGVGSGVHHPNGAEKRISIPDYSNAQSEWWNVNWSLGRTAGGSSGSPLYDSNHRIVGVLSWGYSYCTNDDNDYYGRSFGLSWSYLDDYLDPLGTGQTTLDTLNPANAPTGACCIGTTGACIELHESNCNAGGGTYLGDDTVCEDGGCLPDCPSDVNGDGTTDVVDLLAIVDQWNQSGSPPADVDGDGVVGVGDLLMVIDAWGPC